MADGYSQIHYYGCCAFLNFGDVQEKWVIYIGGSLAIVVTLLAGLWLVREEKKKGE